MSKGKPFHVRKAAYDITLVTQGRWLKSEGSRQKLEDLGFFRQLYSIVVQIARADYNRSFLKMMEVLPEEQVRTPISGKLWTLGYPSATRDQKMRSTSLQTLTNWYGHNPPSLNGFLGKLEDEWTAIPGRPLHGLSANRLELLAEITR